MYHNFLLPLERYAKKKSFIRVAQSKGTLLCSHLCFAWEPSDIQNNDWSYLQLISFQNMQGKELPQLQSAGSAVEYSGSSSDCGTLAGLWELHVYA